MIKHLAFAFLFFAASFSFAQELTATQKIPANAAANSEFIVEVTINRGQINGFMKFFQPLPEGFTAKEIDSKGGSFTFAENGAKIVWIAPPGELTYTISYKIMVHEAANGAKILGGKVSYIYNNERKAFDLENKTIIIDNSAEVAKLAAIRKEAAKIDAANAEAAKAEAAKVEAAKAAALAISIEMSKTEAKKETTTKTPVLPLSSKTPVTAIPSSPGKTFRVQVGAYNLKPKITGVPEHSTIILDNGMTKHFSGNFSSYEDAVKRKKQMIDKGYNGAFIVSFENGKIVK